MRKSNFGHLIKDEIVKRFESVVREEIKLHNIAVEKSNQDISDLKSLFEDHKNLLILMGKKHHQDLMTINKTYEDIKVEVKEQQNISQQEIWQKEKAISEILDDFKALIQERAKNEELLKFEEEITAKFDKLSDHLKKDKEKFKGEIYVCHDNISQNLKIEIEKMMTKLSDFEKQMVEFKKNLSINIVDAEGIRRSQKVDQKTMYVMEKKIEHIYSEIKKIKKSKE